VNAAEAGESTTHGDHPGMKGPSALERIRQTRRLLQTEGAAGVSDRIRTRLSARIAPSGLGTSAVAREDLVRAGEIARAGWRLPDTLAAAPGEPLTIAWVTGPPGAGSGGHTTMLRMVTALERAGHRCILYLDDRHGWAREQHEQVIRTWWPWVKTEVRDAADGIEDAHGIFATTWPTAYRVLASPARGKRFYFVQDFEPWFYPAGTNALLAEATYRFGFHGVTAGRWLTDVLRRDYGMAADHFDFGRDPVYTLDEARRPEDRAGVCLFARPETPRRATELAVLALELFAERHPEVEVHTYGDELSNLPFRATQHGLLKPSELNALYNRCVAGLVLSATNVSLVPHEMLAAGCIPVVNDMEHNRIVLANDHVEYAAGTPFELAAALESLVTRPVDERAAAASDAAGSVQSASWEVAGEAVARIVTDVVRGTSAVVPAHG
jgi:glycosyltransferase involved in cell wall biosynthesis